MEQASSVFLHISAFLFDYCESDFMGRNSSVVGSSWRYTEPLWIWIDLRSVRTMTTMRSVVADTVGEPSEVLHLQTRPIPEPGPGQVRIRVAAAPVEASDLHTIRGRYGFTPEFPTVPGIESVGVIDELGSGTDGLTVGQRVVTIGVTGTWQEYRRCRCRAGLACSRWHEQFHGRPDSQQSAHRRDLDQ